MDTFVALSQSSFHSQEVRALGRPVSGATSSIFFARDHNSGDSICLVLLTSLEDASNFFIGKVDRPVTLLVGGQLVLQSHVAKGAPHHYLVVAAAGAEGVEVTLLHSLVNQVLSCRSAQRDGRCWGDMVGGNEVA